MVNYKNQIQKAITLAGHTRVLTELEYQNLHVLQFGHNGATTYKSLHDITTNVDFDNTGFTYLIIGCRIMCNGTATVVTIGESDTADDSTPTVLTSLQIAGTEVNEFYMNLTATLKYIISRGNVGGMENNHMYIIRKP